MFACSVTVFSESRLWECRVFTLFADNLVIYEYISTEFAETRLWECRVFSFENALGRLCKVLCSFGKIGKALVCFGKLLGGFARLREIWGGFGIFCKVKRLWEAL